MILIRHEVVHIPDWPPAHLRDRAPSNLDVALSSSDSNLQTLRKCPRARDALHEVYQAVEVVHLHERTAGATAAGGAPLAAAYTRDNGKLGIIGRRHRRLIHREDDLDGNAVILSELASSIHDR